MGSRTVPEPLNLNLYKCNTTSTLWCDHRQRPMMTARATSRSLPQHPGEGSPPQRFEPEALALPCVRACSIIPARGMEKREDADGTHRKSLGPCSRDAFQPE